MKTILSLFLALAVPQSVMSQQPYCTQYPNQTRTDPSVTFPRPPFPVMPTTFMTRVEANIQDKGYSATAIEYFDHPNNRAAIRLMQGGQEIKMVFDYKNDQLLQSDAFGNCAVTNLTTDDNNLLFGNQLANGIPHTFSTQGVLHFAQRFGETYMGKATVRGIQCDHWQSCLKWPQLSSTFTLDYYFTAQNWTDPLLYPAQIPVRAVAKGIELWKNGTKYNFLHTYDYVDFRTDLPTTDGTFETPSGVICPGRKQTRPVPQLGQFYMYREEIVLPGNQGVRQADVWYDYQYKLVRFDYRPPSAGPPTYSTDPITEIDDYNTGVSYIIDKAMGNCTVMPIQNSTFDARVNVTQALANKTGAFVLKMKTPDQLFFLDNSSYFFSGQRMVRGVLCDVFIASRNDFTLAGYQPFTSIFQFYFLAKSWQETNNQGLADATATDIPIRLDISAPTVNFQITYNIYNWVQEHPDLSNFDITPCFSDAERMPFKISFPGTYDNTVAGYKRLFQEESLLLTAQIAHISPLRIQKTAFHMEPDVGNFLGTLMARAPPVAEYRKIPGRVQQYINDITFSNVSDPHVCAAQCDTYTNFTCNSFDLCQKQQLCSLSRRHVDDGKLVSNAGCDHYSRTLGGATAPEKTLSVAWIVLRDMVVRGQFVLTIPFSDGSSHKYKAGTISNQVLSPSTLVEKASPQNLKQYRVMYNKNIPNFDDIQLTGLAVDDCATACVNEYAFQCNSFEYYYDTGLCSLSHLHPDEYPQRIQTRQFCDLYVRSYTYNFYEMPGQTVLSSSNAIYQNIYSANQCAKLCVDYRSFHCLSFDYCDAIGTCFLGKTHVLDVPRKGIKADPMCNHYSRNYIADFTFNKRHIIQNKDSRIVVGVSLQQCAKMCVNEESFSCASFDYCDLVTECRLSTASLKNIGQTTLTPSATCDTYTRDRFPDGTPYTPNAKKYYGTPNTGYSGGSMAGIAFGMLIIGLLLTAGGLLAWFKFRGGFGSDDMKTQFVKDEA